MLDLFKFLLSRRLPVMYKQSARIVVLKGGLVVTARDGVFRIERFNKRNGCFERLAEVKRKTELVEALVKLLED